MRPAIVVVLFAVLPASGAGWVGGASTLAHAAVWGSTVASDSPSALVSGLVVQIKKKEGGSQKWCCRAVFSDGSKGGETCPGPTSMSKTEIEKEMKAYFTSFFAGVKTVKGASCKKAGK